MTTEAEDNERFRLVLNEQEKAGRRAIYLAIVAAFAATLGGLSQDIYSHVAKENPGYQLVVAKEALDANTPVGVYRFDPKSGQVAYIKRLDDGATQWVVVPDSHDAAAKSASILASPSSNAQTHQPAK